MHIRIKYFFNRYFLAEGQFIIYLLKVSAIEDFNEQWPNQRFWKLFDASYEVYVVRLQWYHLSNMASQITSNLTVYSSYQSSSLLALVTSGSPPPPPPPTKGQKCRKCAHVIILSISGKIDGIIQGQQVCPLLSSYNYAPAAVNPGQFLSCHPVVRLDSQWAACPWLCVQRHIIPTFKSFYELISHSWLRSIFESFGAKSMYLEQR